MTDDMVRRHERAARLRFLLARAADEVAKGDIRRGGTQAAATRNQWVILWEGELAHLKARHGSNVGTQYETTEGK